MRTRDWDGLSEDIVRSHSRQRRANNLFSFVHVDIERATLETNIMRQTQEELMVPGSRLNRIKTAWTNLVLSEFSCASPTTRSWVKPA